MKKDIVKEIVIDNPFKSKKFTLGLLGVTAVLGLVIGTYAFANIYTVNLRSPILLQNPIMVNERLIQVEIKQEESKEATSEAEPVKKTSFSPSDTLIKQTAQRPDVYSRIVAIFGSESMKYGELISRESSLNPQAINPSSGACGLAQALPCEKMDCSLDDVDCQLAWISEYVEARYGNIDNALAFHDANNWY